MRRAIGVVLIFCLFTSPLYAATADQSTGLLTVRHNQGSIEVQDGAGQLVSRNQLKSGLSYRIRPNETVDISIDDPNPLLYTYEWKLGTLKNSDNYDAVTKFANAINPALGLLQTLTGVPRSGAEQAGGVGAGCEALSTAESIAICGAGVDSALIARYAKQYDDLLAFSKKIPIWIKNSAGSKSAADNVKKAVLEHSAVLSASDMAADIKKIKGARNARATALKTRAFLFQQKPVLIASLNSALGISGLIDDQSSPGTGGPLPQPGTKPGENPVQTPKNQSESKLQEEIDKLNRRINQLESEKAAAAAERELMLSAERELIQNFSVLLPTIEDAEDALAALDTFVGLVKKINEPIILGSLPYNSKQVQPATLTIKTVPANASSVDPSVKTGQFDFSFQAFNVVNYYVDAGPVYSFIEAPEYGTEEINGKHRIIRVDKGDEVNGATLGAMLTLVPRAWSDPTFGGGFQVAITPESDKLGFYIGAVLRLFDIVSLGGGLAYQQTQRLAPGLVVGQDLDTTDALKTNTVFKAGPYVSISIKLK